MKGQDENLVLVRRFAAGNDGLVERAGYIRRNVLHTTMSTLVKRGCCSPVVERVQVYLVRIRGVRYQVGHTGLDGQGKVEKAAWTLTLPSCTPLPRDIDNRRTP